jgi:multidrug efflux pump subunit AcrB
LQQGEIFSAPIEVRISGEDLGQLKSVAQQVERIYKETPGSEYVHNDWREDSYELRVSLKEAVANRLGFTNASVARSLAASFEGTVVSTFWEGSRAVDILLRLDENRRRSFDNVRDAYLTSPVTGAKVPLREIGSLTPEWETGRITRRNGVRTITVRSFFQRDVYASRLLNLTKSKIDAIALPAGCRIAYGGEKESQSNMTGGIVTAAIISVVLIFLILLFQFHSSVQALVVMSSIPLAIFGAAVGLLVIRMPFSFVAQIGLIGVGGVVVRNSILLVDYINGRRRAGDTIIDAAHEAGARRLRPIFLTTMAAAVGVAPMILSGSLMWAPMAAVIAFGLIFSMFFTLLVVPALYVVTAGRESATPGGHV